MALDLGELVARTRVDLDGLDQGLGQARRQLASTGDSMDETGRRGGRRFGGGMLAGVKGFMGPIAGMIGGAAIIGGFNSLTGAASDFNETMSKSEAIFGKQQSAMNKWASNAARTVGMSKAAALDAAAGFGDMFSQIGFTGQQAAKMSQQVVQASADLGSFSNLDTADVSDRIAAAFRGEYDSLQAVIPNINAARVNTEALSMSGKKNASQLTAQEKAAAVLAIVQKDGARAMGDFARTSDGAANKSRIQAARMEDLKTKAGQLLLPIKQLALDGLSLLLTGIEKLGPLMSRLGDFFKPAIDTVKLFFGTITGKGADVGDLPWMDQVIDAGAAVADFLSNLGASIGPILSNLGALFTGTILPAIQQLASYIATNLLPVFQTVAQVIMGNVVPIITTFAGFLTGTLYPAVLGIVTSVGAKLKPVFDALFAAIQTQVLPAVQGLLAKFAEWQPTIQRVITVVVQIVGKVLEFAAAILGKVLPVVIQFAAFLIGNLVKAVGAVIGVVIAVIGKVIDFGGAVVGAVKKAAEFARGVREKFGDALDFIKGIPGKIISAFGEVGSMLLGVGKDIVGGLIEGIKSMAGDVVRVLVDLLPGPLKKFAGKLGIASPSKVFRAFGVNTVQGYLQGLSVMQRPLDVALGRMAGSITEPVVGSLDSAPASVRAAAAAAAGGGVGSGRVLKLEDHINVDGREIGRASRSFSLDEQSRNSTSGFAL